jgi:hypothetical protein
MRMGNATARLPAAASGVGPGVAVKVGAGEGVAVEVAVAAGVAEAVTPTSGVMVGDAQTAEGSTAV